MKDFIIYLCINPPTGIIMSWMLQFSLQGSLGLVTVILHNLWVADWRVAVTILGWTTFIKGMMKIGFPEHIHTQAQMLKAQQKLWGLIIILMGAWLFWMSI